MRGNKKVEAYIPNALEYFKNDLLTIRQRSKCKTSYRNCIDVIGLQEAVHRLPKNQREKIERFWGLNGGTNHSRRLGRDNSRDIAYKKMCSEALEAVEELQTLDYLKFYDQSISIQIDLIARKINKKGLEISDMECVKYLMAFFIYMDNGPKMSFEEEEMEIDTDLDGTFLLDEIEVLSEMYEEISKYQDNTINLRLLIDSLEMMDFKDMLAIKKSMGIEINSSTLPKKMKFEDIDIVRSVSSVRELKERVFPYGAWNVVTELIIGTTETEKKLANFMKELNSIRKDWARIADFKIGEKKLRITGEIRTLNVYKIGELIFTDAYEVMFLYLERNLIETTE